MSAAPRREQHAAKSRVLDVASISDVSLTKGENELHLLPRQGPPRTGKERLAQKTVKCVAFLPVYTAIVVTIILLLAIFGVPVFPF